MRRFLAHPLTWILIGLLVFAATATAVGARAPAAGSQAGTSSPAACTLKSPLKHVVYVVFDNVHFARDNPNVPSDLEQMPHLLNFLKSSGTLLSNHHTPLIAHTGGDILTGLTGLYPDRTGQAVSNSYRYFKPGGTLGSGETFTYWTSRVYDPNDATSTDTSYNLVGERGANAPAPWAAFTKAGCDVGAAGVNGMVLESTKTLAADTDGVAVHCAQGSAFCAGTASRPDALPDEPGGYTGFRALFGHQQLAPKLGPLQDLAGRPLDAFPGFGSLRPEVTLAYLAAMQERGVPVTFGYIGDAHGADGPGAAAYVARLRDYDQALQAFFDRLGRDGLDAGNTLFVFTADEGDHFAGGKPAPAGCDGLYVACTYGTLGLVALDLTGLLAQHGVATRFGVHADSAPAVYLEGDPAPAAAVTRAFEQAAWNLRAPNPYSAQTEQPSLYLADRPELKLLHMVTGDPARTPTFVDFLKPDYFGGTGSASCAQACVRVDAGNPWNHGSVAPEMNVTWLGLAGPGVANQGVDAGTWSDEADIRPTLLFLLGLRDSYRTDGRVLLEALDPHSLGPSRAAFFGLALAYKRVNAPLGDLGLKTLKEATVAISSAGAGDTAYNRYAGQAATLAADRDALAARMAALLDGAAFAGKPLDPAAVTQAVEQADALLGRNLL